MVKNKVQNIIHGGIQESKLSIMKEFHN